MATDMGRIRVMPLTVSALHSPSLQDSTNGSRIVIAKSDLPDSPNSFRGGTSIAPSEGDRILTKSRVGHYLPCTICQLHSAS